MAFKTYLQKADSPDFWQNHWEEILKGESLEQYCQKFKDSWILKNVFKKYLPQQGKILEAGCGLGVWVYLLKERGYSIEGIDFAEKTVNFVNSNLPELAIKNSDVFNLNYPDNSFKGYISMGVVEHFEQGPGEILKEANRILDKKGVIILTVPYFNSLRRLKNFLGFYKNQKGDFYQYFFSAEEIKKYIKKSGFKIKKAYRYNAAKCLRDELLRTKKNYGLIFRKEKSRPDQRFLKNLVNSFPIRFLCSHMIIIIAEKI